MIFFVAFLYLSPNEIASINPLKMKNYIFIKPGYLLLSLALLFSTAAWAQSDACCTRKAAVSIQSVKGDVLVSLFESLVFKTAINDCPLSVEKVILPSPGEGIKDWQDLVASYQLDYVFVGEHKGMEEGGESLKVNLIHVARLEILKSGEASWLHEEEAPNKIIELANAFQPLDNLIYDYEGMPLRAELKAEKQVIDIGKRMTISIAKLLHGNQPAKAWQSIFIKTKYGEIGNANPVGKEKLWTVNVGERPLELGYFAPKECKNLEEVITLYNTCDYNPMNQLAPDRAGPKQEIGRISFRVLCPSFTIDIVGKIEYKDESEDYTYQGTYDIKLIAQFRTTSNNDFHRLLEIEKIRGSYKYFFKKSNKKCPYTNNTVLNSSGPIKMIPTYGKRAILIFQKKNIFEEIVEIENFPMAEEFKVKATPPEGPGMLPSNSFLLLLSYDCNEIHSHSIGTPLCKPGSNNHTYPEFSGGIMLLAPLTETKGRKSWIAHMKKYNSFDTPFSMIEYSDKDLAENKKNRPNPPGAGEAPNTTVNLQWWIKKLGPGGV